MSNNLTYTCSFFIDFCTDEGFSHNKCLDHCNRLNHAPEPLRVTPCDTANPRSDRWCCGENNSCCESGDGVFVLQPTFLPSQSSSAVVSTKELVFGVAPPHGPPHQNATGHPHLTKLPRRGGSLQHNRMLIQSMIIEAVVLYIDLATSSVSWCVVSRESCSFHVI